MTNFRHSSENDVKTQLSMKEMLEISSEIRQCFSPDVLLDQVQTEPAFELSRAELLEVSQKISLYYAPTRLSTSQKLAILSIDPEHLYIYWDLGKNQAPALAQKLVNDELSLCIVSQSDEGEIPLYKASIREMQSGKIIKLGFVDKATIYSASIGRAGLDNDFISLIKSNKTHAFQGKEDKTEKKLDSLKSKQFIDLVKQDDLNSESGSRVSCFNSSNHSANGKKA